MQAELERQGIVTASITMLPEITRRVQPPRALAVPFDLGYPLGAPNNGEQQRQVLRALLRSAVEQELPWLGDLSGMSVSAMRQM